ncbi:hypothetical protein BDV12DRAFT_186670 [Aspergillus spectabilis]
MANFWHTNYLILLLSGGIGYLTYLTLPCRSMKFTWRAQPGHAQSFAMRVMDPGANPTQEESYILRLPLRKLRSGIDDEEILARFSRGYFGGWMFTPERWIAPYVQGIIDHDVFARSRVPGYATSDIYKISSPNGLSSKHLPPLGACLFSLYYLLESSICSPGYRTEVFLSSGQTPRPDRSFVEYAGRTKGRSLAASHQFEVIREAPVSTPGGEEYVTIIYSHVRSNPRTGGRVYSRPMTAMHICYAHLLFADGIREVLGC